MSELKPWNELPPLERRAQIARRIGWTELPSGEWSSPRDSWDHLLMHSEMSWPTSDGLAFTEVWPAIMRAPHSVLLCLAKTGSGKVGVWSITNEGIDPEWISTTWIDAICQCAYDFLPEAPNV